MNRKRIAINEVIWDIGVELIGLDETEVTSLLRCKPWQVVELEAHDLDGVVAVLARVAEPVVGAGLAVSANSPHELDDRMVEVERQAHLGAASADLVGLHLSDELLEGTRGEAIALVDVKVHVGGLDE